MLEKKMKEKRMKEAVVVVEAKSDLTKVESRACIKVGLICRVRVARARVQQQPEVGIREGVRERDRNESKRNEGCKVCGTWELRATV